MASQYDHIKRDALHAARAEVSILVTKYTRRLHETAISFIDSERAKSDGQFSGDNADGTFLGREAAKSAEENWIGIGGSPSETIDAASPAIETYAGS